MVFPGLEAQWQAQWGPLGQMGHPTIQGQQLQLSHGKCGPSLCPEQPFCWALEAAGRPGWGSCPVRGPGPPPGEHSHVVTAPGRTSLTLGLWSPMCWQAAPQPSRMGAPGRGGSAACPDLSEVTPTPDSHSARGLQTPVCDKLPLYYKWLVGSCTKYLSAPLHMALVAWAPLGLRGEL